MREIEAAHVQTRKQADAILQPYEPVESTRQFLLTNAVTTNGPEGAHLTFRVAIPTLERAAGNALGTFPYRPPSSSPDSTSPVDSGSGEGGVEEEGKGGAETAQWDGPTLFVRGSQSDYVLDKYLPEARAFFPKLEVVTLDAGHWVHAEKPVETGEAVIDFVKRASG